MIGRLHLITFCVVVAGIAHAQERKPGDGSLTEAMRLGDRRWYSQRDLDDAAMSPDGKFVVFAGSWQIGTWNAETGAPLHTYEARGVGHFSSVACAPDGLLYAAGQHNGVFCYRTDTHELVRMYEKHKSMVWRVELSADGSRLVSAGGSEVIVWKMPEGTVVRKFNLKFPQAGAPAREYVSISPDGKLVVVPSENGKPFEVYDVDTGELRPFEYESPGYAMHSLFSPDSRKLLIFCGTRLMGYDVAAGRPLNHLTREVRSSIGDMAVSPDGRTLALVGSWGLELSSLETGKVIHALEGPGGTVNGVVFSRDGKTLYAGGSQQAIFRWDVSTGKLLNSKSGHAGSIGLVAWPTMRRILTASVDGSVRHWNADSGVLEKVVAIPRNVYARRFTPDGRWLLGRSDHHLHVVDASTGDAVKLEADIHWDHQPALSPDGKWVAYPHAMEQRAWHEIRLIAVDGKSAPRTLSGPHRRINAVVYSADGARLAVGYDQNYRELPAPPMPQGIGALGFSGSPILPRKYETEPTVVVYDVGSGRVIESFGQDQQYACCLEFAPSGRYLAIGVGDNSAKVWDFERKAMLPGIVVDHTSVTQFAFTPDERYLIPVCGMTGNGFSMYELETLTRLSQSRGHQHNTFTVASSPDGRRVVSGGRDALGIVWNVQYEDKAGSKSAVIPTPDEMSLWWRQLGDPEASRAEAAYWRFVASRDAGAAFLKSRLRPVPPIDLRELADWLAQLDDPHFTVRDAATKNLERQAFTVESELRAHLAATKSAEVQKRLSVLLGTLNANPDRLRALRSLSILEAIHTPTAVAVLENLAAGEPRDRLTRNATFAFKRSSSAIE